MPIRLQLSVDSCISLAVYVMHPCTTHVQGLPHWNASCPAEFVTLIVVLTPYKCELASVTLPATLCSCATTVSASAMLSIVSVDIVTMVFTMVDLNAQLAQSSPHSTAVRISKGHLCNAYWSDLWDGPMLRCLCQHDAPACMSCHLQNRA